jgi:hypothetical protein
MPSSFSISVDDRELHRATSRLLSGVSDFRKLPLGGWRPFADIRYRHQLAHLSSEGATSGRPFYPLKARYREAKIRAGFPDTILYRTGYLFRSFVQKGALANVHEEGPAELAMGSRDPNARRHQYGTKRMISRDAVRVTDRKIAEHERQLFRTMRALGAEVGFGVTA